MSDWRPSRSDPEAELKEADLLLEKADALLRRHKLKDARDADAQPADEDLPLLTDIVDNLDIDPLLQPTLSRNHPEAVELAELLVTLDTELAREIELWFATELPQLVTRELDGFAARMREEAVAHMRATLIPALSERISTLLGSPFPPAG